MRITMSLPEKYTATGLTIIFSPGTGEWCPEICVTWYADGAKLRQEIAYPTEASWTVPATVENFDRVTVELIRTNIPGHYAKVQSIELGQVIWFGRDELVSVHLVNEVDPTLSDLTVDTMSVTVQDKQNRYLIPQEKQKMELYRNDQLVAVQYIESSSREAQRYSFSCQSAIGLLEDDYLGGIYSATPIENVLDDTAQVVIIGIEENPSIIKYNFLRCRVNHGTEEAPQWKDILLPVEMTWNEANEEIAKKEAYNGAYTIEEVADPASEPSQLDIIEAQVTYTAMMTDTLLEV